MKNPAYFLVAVLLSVPAVVFSQGVGIQIDPPVSILHIYENTGSVGTTTGLTIEQDGAGDSEVQFLLTGGQRWVMGIDNSNNDNFKIASSTNLANDVRITIETDGDIGIGTASPTSLFHLFQNNTATGNAAGMIIENNGTGDAVLQYVQGAQRWFTGIDNSDSDKYKVASNSDLASNARLTIQTNGNVGVGVDATAPEELLHIGNSNGGTASVLVEGNNGGGMSAEIIFQDQTQTSPNGNAYLGYNDVEDAFSVFVHDSEVIRIDDVAAVVDADCNGTWTDNAFGPSEWVIGQADEGDVVCMVGSKMDDDGVLRAVVEPCTKANSSNAIGVVIPKDKSAAHGNPEFSYRGKLEERTGNYWRDEWKKTHVGVELTGFRMTKVIGNVKVGDILVSSDVPGYAMVTDQPELGAIIGKAAEDFNGEKGMVWARIHMQSGSNLYGDVNSLKQKHEELDAKIQALDRKMAEIDLLLTELRKQASAR